MRRVLANDVKAAAAALTKLPPPERKRMCELWIHQADWAHKHMKATGKPHPVWRDGSLTQAIHIAEIPTLDFASADYCAAMETVIACLVERKSPSQRRN